MKLLIPLEKITREQIQKAIKDPEWQKLRKELRGTPLNIKIGFCNIWLQKNKFSKRSKIQIINYINALKRSAYSRDILKYLQN